MTKKLTLFLFLLISFSSQLFADSNSPILNFSKVNNEIYRGARITSINSFIYLKSLGIKNIINLQGGDLDSPFADIIPWAAPGELPINIAKQKYTAKLFAIETFHQPLGSLEPVTIDEDKAIDDTLEFMHDPNNQPIFIHCEHGADRTGLLVALYRIKYEGISPRVAWNEWVKNGHNALHRMFTYNLDFYFLKKIKDLK